MRSKLFSLIAFGILAIFLVGLASATAEFVPATIDQTLIHGKDISFSFQLNDTDHANNTLTWTTSTSEGTLTLSSQPTLLPANGTLPLSATLTDILKNFTGDVTGTISVSDMGSPLGSLPFTITITAPSEIVSCNSIENKGNLKVKKIDFNNNGFSGREFGSDDEWFPFEEIEVEIEIENDDYDIDDISVEWGIYSIKDEDWLIDMDEEDEFDLKDGDRETLIVTFKLDDDLDLDLDQFVDDEENYRFYVVATGTIDDNNSPHDGDDTCVFDYEPASIIIESDFIVLDNIKFPESAKCGETIEITADVWNIGSDQQDDVSVFVTNKEFGLIEDILVGDIDEFDNQHLSFTFTVPKNVTEKTYAIEFEVYDEDNDIYENDFDDDPARFTLPLKISGNCAVEPEVSVSATLESGAKAGEEMKIKITLGNLGSDTRTFMVDVENYGAWAELSESPGTITLNSGSSGETYVNLDVDKDASSGEKTFNILVYEGTELIKTQPISVNIESRNFLGITGFSINEGNGYLWGLGLLNVILVIVIIIVAVRVARRK